ncbi:MAG: hypothetical protein WCK77_09820 [Verrucomicrobiota bacterium]
MTEMKSVVWYLLASVALAAGIYGSALWGARILAPLDIGPDLLAQYQYMDPSADGIPDNHHIIDQFTYDLPLQYTIYRAYHAGEIPWWDPYTYGGRPLLADAHVNGTDPVRLACYAALPFELAYNWNYILRGILTGLGMFLLLRSFGVTAVIAGILALTYQFAGWFTLYWGHPWVQGSFVYFPYLWLVWLRSMQGRLWLHVGLGGLLCGLVFYAGNLQSHTYLPLFALSFLAAVLIKTPKLLWRAFTVTALSGVLGALLASPVLFNQVEFFLFSSRSISEGGGCAWYYRVLAIPFSLGSYYPWMFGTFKTLDIGYSTKMNGMGFQWFCGIGCACLAAWGLWVGRRTAGALGMVICQSGILIGLYLCVVATPLATYLYCRCAPLAGMGLIVLAALTAQAIIDRKVQAPKWLVQSMVVGVVLTGLGTSALAWWVYPMFKARISRIVTEADKSNAAMVSAPKLRERQVNAFPSEVSLANPEAALTLVGVLLLGFALTREKRAHVQTGLAAALLVSAMPVLIFHARYSPSQPVGLWQQFLSGSPLQQKAKELLDSGLRLAEPSTRSDEIVFTHAIAAMHRVHVVQGYSALQPPCLFCYPATAAPIPDGWLADYAVAPTQGAPLAPAFNKASELARFRLLSNGAAAPVSIAAETHNRLTLDATRVPAGETLVRTDTYYPGWTVSSGPSKMRLAQDGVCFSKIPLGQAAADGKIVLEYSPRYLPIAWPCCVSGMLLVAASLLGGLASPAFRRPVVSDL